MGVPAGRAENGVAVRRGRVSGVGHQRGEKAMPKNIYKKSGWYYGRKTIDGVEHNKALDTKSQGEAKERAAAWIEELKGTDWTKPVITFNDAVNYFIETHFPRLKQNTRTRYLNSLMHFADIWEGMALDNIGSAELSAFETARRKAGIADATIIRDLSCLSILFEVAIDGEKATGNPANLYLKKAKRRRGLSEAPPKSRFFSPDEERAIIHACRDMDKGSEHSRMMLGIFVVLDIDTGLRTSELLSLKWTDVYDDEIYVVPSSASNRNKSKVGRRVPLLARSARLLKMMPRNPSCPYVIYNRQGTRYDELYHLFVGACAHAGITDASPHDLRRTCGVRLLRDHIDSETGKRGMSMERVSKWLGHSSIKVTERHYAFLSVDSLHEAVGTRKRAEALPETDLTKLLQLGGR
jgi:integrase/recombinase XerD